MHVLFLSDNFPPESNAPANRVFEHGREWIKKGHKVTVITCAPNFPEGRLFKGYKNKWIFKENIEGMDVWRVKTYIAANIGFWRRILDFLSFMMSSMFFGIFTRKIDIVIGTSPQFFTAISAWVLSKIKRVPFIFELRDLWPDSIVAVNLMRHDSKVILLLKKLELFLYHQADLIIAVTKEFQIELINRGIPVDKIKIITNGANPDKYKPNLTKNTELSFRYGLRDKFVAGYIGTHGMAHSIDVVIEAARIIKDEKHIRFLFVGAGSERERIKKLVSKYELFNVKMIPIQKSECMPEVWSLCNISIVTLKNTPLFASMISSRIFESMAMKLPIIISTPEGAATRLIRDSGSGLIVPAEDSRKLSESILKLAKDTELQNRLASNSLLASKKFNRKNLALEMLNHIEKLAKN